MNSDVGHASPFRNQQTSRLITYTEKTKACIKAGGGKFERNISSSEVSLCFMDDFLSQLTSNIWSAEKNRLVIEFKSGNVVTSSTCLKLKKRHAAVTHLFNIRLTTKYVKFFLEIGCIC